MRWQAAPGVSGGSPLATKRSNQKSHSTPPGRLMVSEIQSSCASLSKTSSVAHASHIREMKKSNAEASSQCAPLERAACIKN